MRRLFALLLSLCGCVPAGKAPIYTNRVAGAIGGPCSADGDCRSGTCDTSTFIGYRGEAAGGFCTKLCTADSECAPGKCEVGGDGKGYCVAQCHAQSHCRDDYKCYAFGDYCVPVLLLTLDCDPMTEGGLCTRSDGSTGACIRQVIGDGPVGLCEPSCELGGPDCASGSGCHYTDVSRFGDDWKNDPFKGLRCIENTTTPPTGVGGSCTFSSDCASYADCAHDPNTGLDQCVAYCEPGFGCANGSSCTDFNPPLSGVGYCPL